MFDKTHLVICRTKEILDFLIEESFLIGKRAQKGVPMSQGDALVAKDILIEGGFNWGKDFYLRKL